MSLPPSLRSCLYECHMVHHRHHPKSHRFRNRIFFACLDLEELETLHCRLKLFSRNRTNLYTLRENDYLPQDEGEDAYLYGLRDRVEQYLRRQGLEDPLGRVLLLTIPRIGGYWFNPISLYYVQDPAGNPLCAIAEVSNTFREVKAYYLPPESHREGKFQHQLPKHFYVSPFSALTPSFHFNTIQPEKQVRLRIDEREGDQLLLQTALVGRRRPLNDLTLLRMALQYPMLGLRVMAQIHYQALRLHWKRIPYFRKSDRPDLQQDLWRPCNGKPAISQEKTTAPVIR